MIGEIVFMAVLAVVAVAVIWKSAKKRTNPKGTGKSCCD